MTAQPLNDSAYICWAVDSNKWKSTALSDKIHHRQRISAALL